MINFQDLSDAKRLNYPLKYLSLNMLKDKKLNKNKIVKNIKEFSADFSFGDNLVLTCKDATKYLVYAGELILDTHIWEYNEELRNSKNIDDSLYEGLKYTSRYLESTDVIELINKLSNKFNPIDDEDKIRKECSLLLINDFDKVLSYCLTFNKSALFYLEGLLKWRVNNLKSTFLSCEDVEIELIKNHFDKSLFSEFFESYLID